MWTHKHNNLNQFQPRIKSRHLPPLSKAEQSRFTQDDEDCLAKAYFVTAAQATVPTQDKKNSESTAIQEKFTQISTLFRTDEKVQGFLRRNEFLFLPLLQAIEPIKNAFDGLPTMRLELVDEGASQQLFVVIATSLAPETALTKLNAFDKNWWFKAPPGIHDALEFTVEFV